MGDLGYRSGEPARTRRSGGAAEMFAAIWRAFSEFLALPSLVMAGFVLLAGATYVLDHADVGWLQPLRRAMQEHVFASAQATADLLGEIAGSLLTVASITISLVLLAVQQAAGSLTFQVIDQFLRRRLNQATFGFFVGLALYALLILSTVNPPYNPVYGATLALLLTFIALYLLLTLLYTTIHQMRPSVIVEAIHNHVLAARQRQLPLIRRTRRVSQYQGAAERVVRAEEHGFVVEVATDVISRASQAWGEVEIRLLVSIGTYVAFGDPIAEISAAKSADLDAVEDAVRRSVRLDRQRDLDRDPAYGIEQLVAIAWTSVSTSKQSPVPGLLAVLSLRDILARWSAEQERRDGLAERPLPVVYRDDVFEHLLNAFESMAVVSSESLQHQVFAEVARALALMFGRLRPEQQDRVEDRIRRILSALGEHVPTTELDLALGALVQTLLLAGRTETAGAVQTAQSKLVSSVGKLGSRSTRVPSGD